MTRLSLVHLSDLHFGSVVLPIRRAELLRKVADVVRQEVKHDSALVVAITGDVTTKGQPSAYEEAARHLEGFLSLLNPALVVTCPGNHDITARSDPHFTHFNEFAFRVTNDSRQVFTANNTVSTVEYADTAFLLVNSAYHGDHGRGEVRLEDLDTALENSRSKQCFILLHHSPLSSTYGGDALINGYEFLARAARARVAAVLHGHVHTEQVLAIGPRPTALLGVGSLMFTPSPNYNNEFSIVDFEGDQVITATCYRYLADRREFARMEMPWV
ncbi:calcineurin-like phosphoesterase family protein [Saccharothrix variisporea]|uniref:Calcineurin-like phosphoesterase family protein n=2 Tax=Saccharothrix variisporea TaxID=543527 RepID=A0A495XEI2_9PSEU|nr:metallophosphoesterase [Saccharothrix variisporea]RKT72432.1 calcineurin-like phosphoesterase family protein [Saccharothrix variisporea]